MRKALIAIVVALLLSLAPVATASAGHNPNSSPADKACAGHGADGIGTADSHGGNVVCP